jgi:hypothetical protein
MRQTWPAVPPPRETLRWAIWFVCCAAGPGHDSPMMALTYAWIVWSWQVKLNCNLHSYCQKSVSMIMRYTQPHTGQMRCARPRKSLFRLKPYMAEEKDRIEWDLRAFGTSSCKKQLGVLWPINFCFVSVRTIEHAKTRMDRMQAP